MGDKALVTDEIQAMVGRTSTPVRVVVTPNVVRRTMDTVYGGRSTAPPEGVEVPGIVLMGLEIEAEPLRVPDLLPASLLVGNEWSFERAPRVGEALTVFTRLDSIAERFGSRLGHSVHVRSSVEFADEAGSVIARASRTLAYYDPAEGGPGRG
jgi:hypothetical protein